MNNKVHLPLYGQLRDRVSFSEIGLFSDCQWKWALTKVFSQEKIEESFQMSFGKSIHLGLESLYNGSMSLEESIEIAESGYKQSLDKLFDSLSDEDKIESERLKTLIPKFLNDCLNCEELKDIISLKTEYPLKINIARNDGLDILFKGFIDIVFIKKLKTKSVIYIADFKTCSWGWPYKKFKDIKVISQLLLYKHFFCKELKADPKNISLAFILLKKKPKDGDSTITFQKINASDTQIYEAIQYLQNAITDMHSYSYEKNLDSCQKKFVTKEGIEKIYTCNFFETDLCTKSSEHNA